MICFHHYGILVAETCRRMTTAITFCHSNDAGSLHTRITHYRENLVLIVVDVLESKGLALTQFKQNIMN